MFQPFRKYIKQEDNCISIVLGPRLTRFLLRTALLFEPLAPQAISYYLSRKLNGWKQQKLIGDYKTHTTRLGRYHYKIEVDLDLNQNQVHYIVSRKLPKRKALRRWFNV